MSKCILEKPLPSNNQHALLRVFVIPLSSERRQIPVEVMAVYNLSVSIVTYAVQVVPHSDAVVNAGGHQLAACLRAEICTVDQTRVL